MKYYRVELGGIEPWMLMYSGDLTDHRAQWVQQPDHWTLFFLEHAGAFTLNNRVSKFEDGYVAIVGPGVKAGFLNVGPGTTHYAITFGITKRRESFALPALTDLGDMKEIRREELRDADRWLHKSIGRGLAFTYNLLWSIMQPAEILRSSDLMYDFENLVTSRLSEKLTVVSLAAELDISPSQLLRSVKAEYNQTVQQYLRDKRAEIAKTLILTSDLPLKTIAAKTGMPDLQYFNKAIRSVSGLSPSALRAIAVNKTLHW